MTKKQLLKILEDIPDEAEIDIYDLRNYSHPVWRIEKEQYFDYNNGTPIVTIELSD